MLAISSHLEYHSVMSEAKPKFISIDEANDGVRKLTSAFTHSTSNRTTPIDLIIQMVQGKLKKTEGVDPRVFELLAKARGYCGDLKTQIERYGALDIGIEALASPDLARKDIETLAGYDNTPKQGGNGQIS